MHILLSNDDGILAPGLAALRMVVEDLGRVSVVAPDSPQSAAAHAITLRTPLTVHRLELEGLSGERFSANSVAGRPADCVRLALRMLLDEPVDLVLTGINAGSNVGVNVFYSGTVAAAAEGAMLGLPAVAFSAHADSLADLPLVGRCCRWVLDGLIHRGIRGGDLINVNIPACGASRLPKGICVVSQSTAGIADEYLVHPSDEGLEQYRLGDNWKFHPASQDSDVERLADGYITITPLHFDMTDRIRLGELAGDWRLPDNFFK